MTRLYELQVNRAVLKTYLIDPDNCINVILKLMLISNIKTPQLSSIEHPYFSL